MISFAIGISIEMGSLDVYKKRSSLYKVCVKNLCWTRSRTVGCVFTGSRRCVYKSKYASRLGLGALIQVKLCCVGRPFFTCVGGFVVNWSVDRPIYVLADPYMHIYAGCICIYGPIYAHICTAYHDICTAYHDAYHDICTPLGLHIWPNLTQSNWPCPSQFVWELASFSVSGALRIAQCSVGQLHSKAIAFFFRRPFKAF